MTKLLSVVVSVYNEELALREFYAETGKILKRLPGNWDYEFLFVNDGSRDQSLSILKEFAASDEKVKIVNFSRNFGHEAAMIAGLDYAGGDGIVCMDADLQHPPECLPEIVEKFDEGYEVISMVRTRNKTAGLVKNGIGMTGAHICIALCVVPLAQIACIAFLYKLAAAIIQPVSLRCEV